MSAPDSGDAADEGRWRLWLIRGVAVAAVVYTVYYLAWRWTETLNPDALFFSVALVAAESWGFFGFLSLVFHAWRLRRRPPVETPPDLDVAIFITTYDEPLAVLRKTAVTAREVRYPHETYILDDGCRDEVEELARDLGVRYIPRESGEHAKAGNLNHALARTSEDFILQLDADHAPLPHILDRLLGYFQDPDVAFVQSPQDFYNLDSFTQEVDEGGRRTWEEQRIFYDIIQPGKDSWNAAFFCGSCAVIRRAALDDVGGISTETITEDVETSLKLHGRGWKSVYVDESLAYGLSPASAGSYQVQRLRWGQGSMQILRKFNPLTYPGLTLAQRFAYFTSLTHYFDGLQRLVFLAAPVIFFFTGVLPLQALDREFLVRFFPYFFLTLLAFELLCRGRGYLWLAERYNMAKWFIYIRSLWGLFTRKRLSFEVTPKGDESTPVRIYLPQLVVLVIAPVSIAWAALAYQVGWVEYGAQGWRSMAFVLNAAWVLWNAYFAWEVVRRARVSGGGVEYAFPEHIPLMVHRTDRSGLEIEAAQGITREVGPNRLRFGTTAPLEAGDQVAVRLELSGGRRTVNGTIMEGVSSVHAGVRFREVLCELDAPTLEDQAAIELHCLHHAVPAEDRRVRYLPDLFEDARRWLTERRGEKRDVVRLPTQVAFVENRRRSLAWYDAILEDTSVHGALLVMEREVHEGSWVRFQLPGADLRNDGVVRHATSVKTSRGRRWSVGVERIEKG